MKITLIVSWVSMAIAFACIVGQLIQKDKHFTNRYYSLFVFGGIVFAMCSVIFSVSSLFM